MSGEASTAFVDTNVLVYAFAENDPRHDVARQLVAQLAESGSLRLSTQVLQEFLVTVTGKLPKRFSTQEALRRMDYFAQWPIYANDYSSIREAVELAGKAVISFWDALIVVAASWSGATILYTEDLNHGQKLLGVTVVNPFK